MVTVVAGNAVVVAVVVANVGFGLVVVGHGVHSISEQRLRRVLVPNDLVLSLPRQI